MEITMTENTKDSDNVETDNVNETTTETTAEATSEVTETPQAPTGGPGLTLGDLRLVARIIQISSERGAIRADEMATVGDLYNRLVQWLNSIQPVPAVPNPDQPVPGTNELPDNAIPTTGTDDSGSDEGKTGE